MNTSNSLKTVLAALALVASVQFSSSQTIPPSLAAPPGSVNTNIPGMKMQIVQGNSGLAMGSAAPAERLISGHAIDPATGLPFVNNATPNPVDGSFFYNIDRYINMHEQIPNNPDAAGGNFFTGLTPAAAPMNIPDEAEPGIPGTTSSGDYFVMEFTGYLQLPAGTVRFGVNSDDGFKLTIGNGINTRVQALQLIILDGTRGFGNTEANITVSSAGIYPFRLLFWENTGGNSGVELYTFAPGTTSGNRYLINDTNQANSIRSYRELVGNPPSILNFFPVLTTYIDVQGNSTAVPAAPYMWVEVLDGGTTLDTNSVTFALDGTLLATNITKSANITTIGAQAPALVANSVHTNTLIYADSGGARFTNVWTFTVGNYPTIPAAYAIASVDTSKPGFKAKVQQMNQQVNKQPNTGQVPNAERQIANGYIDPATGLPYENLADLSSAGTDGFLVYPDVINLNEAPANAGSFPNDAPVQGITGNLNGQEHYVVSIETILDLKAGVYRFGVNSDDGFRLSAGRGPGDVVGVQLATAGDRGPTDSFTDFAVATDGFYPFRLMWWETGGGSACEFFVVTNLATLTKTLINDLTDTAPIKAYRESAASRPYISRVLPTVNFAYAFADQDVIIDITDGAIPLNAGTAALTINGTAQTVAEGKTNNVTTVRRASSVTNLLRSGVNNLSLTYSFTEGGNAVTVTNTWAFTVPRYISPIPLGNKVQQADVSGSGFHVTGYQIDRSGDANQGNGGRYVGQSGNGNNMPRAEIELYGGYINPTNNQPYPNLMLTGGNPPPNPDGSWDIADVLNLNNAQSAGGPPTAANIFQVGEAQVPGLPGAGTSNFGLDNSVNEFTTYLKFPAAGAYILGLNVDDGWTCISAPNPRDTLGTLLGFKDAPGGQNGTPLNNPSAAFNVIVPEAGIYPFRILFWEGGGGVNFEFAELDRGTGTQILVNNTDPANTSTVLLPGNTISSITAYNTYSGPVRPWTKFSVYPMPYIGTVEPRTTTAGQVTLWQNVHQQSGPGPILVKVGAGNPVDIANDEPRPDQALVNKPFGDAVGGVVADLGTGKVGMVLDGANVTPTVTDVPGSSDKLVLYTPPQPLSPSSNHIAGLVYAGTTNYWTFSVITYTNVPATDILASSAADLNAVGFLAKIFQATNGQPNTVSRAELQIAGLTNNVATANSNRGDGAYIITNIINWNVTKNPGGTPAEIGNFQPLLTGTPDDPVPGIPGTGLTGNLRFENITAEIFAYLDLPAGYQKFGVNGDDGWKVQVGTQGQTSGTILFTRDRGTGARDIPFAFVTPQAGLVPIRLVWYQGGGGGNLEFFTYGPNNTKIPVNDRTNPNSVKAYYSVATAPQLRFTSATLGGGNATFTWSGTGVLQQATVLTGSPADWTDVSPQPVGNSIQVPVSSAAQTFYRLKQ
jgi:hypothetical protein